MHIYAACFFHHPARSYSISISKQRREVRSGGGGDGKAQALRGSRAAHRRGASVHVHGCSPHRHPAGAGAREEAGQRQGQLHHQGGPRLPRQGSTPRRRPPL